VPKVSSASCDQAVLVDQAADAGLSSDAVLAEAGRFQAAEGATLLVRAVDDVPGTPPPHPGAATCPATSEDEANTP
jgi:hypothetical protein